MNFLSITRWLMTSGAVLAVSLFVGTAAGQEAPAKEQQLAPAATAPQQAPGSPAEMEVKGPAETSATAKEAVEGPVIPVIQNRKDKMSYALGADLARDLKRQKNDLNLDLLMRALTDSLADKPLIMTDDEVTAMMKQVEADQKQDFEHAKMMISAKNKKAGEAFFAENAKKDGVVTLPSGLQYRILKNGDGKMPTLSDRVVCQYKATLLDGAEFDSSERRGHPVTLPLRGLALPGLTQALQMMPVGSKWQLFLPPQLAYGEKVVNGIGPNATVIFEVELVSIEDKTQTATAK